MGSQKKSRRSFFQTERFKKWLNRRVPPASHVVLRQNNIFILPTRQGLIFVLVLIAMLLAGINYQNSLIYGVAFLLTSLFLVSILHTFKNLSGLNIRAAGCESAFAGEDLAIDVVIERKGKKIFEAINLGWHPDHTVSASLIEDTESRVKLYVETSQRGRLSPGRLRIETFYPVGLFRAWSMVDLDISALVYPRPLNAGAIPAALNAAGEGELTERTGADDFYGLRDYSQGDPLRHVAWKSFARTGDMMVKEFSHYIDHRVWLDWEYFAGVDVEIRLSYLCYWAISLAKTGDEYGLRLPGLEIEPGKGSAHQTRVLRALAEFES